MERRLPVFADRFIELRGKRTQDEFAKFLGISRPTVGFYESGQRIPDAVVLRQIAEKCNVSTDYLLGLTDEKTPCSDIRAICEYTGLSSRAIKVLNESVKVADQFRILQTFINTFLESREHKFFLESAFNDCALKISFENSNKVKDLSDISDDEFDNLRRVAMEDADNRSEYIKALLHGTANNDGTITVRTDEASILYERVSTALLERIYFDTVSKVEQNYTAK